MAGIVTEGDGGAGVGADGEGDDEGEADAEAEGDGLTTTGAGPHADTVRTAAKNITATIFFIKTSNNLLFLRFG